MGKLSKLGRVAELPLKVLKGLDRAVVDAVEERFGIGRHGTSNPKSREVGVNLARI